MFKREDIHVVVVGGETNGYWRILGATYAKTVSVDDWRQAPAGFALAIASDWLLGGPVGGRLR